MITPCGMYINPMRTGGFDLPLSADMNDIGAYAQAALYARKIGSTPAEIERLGRWLARLQPVCSPWADAPEVEAGSFGKALQDASRG